MDPSIKTLIVDDQDDMRLLMRLIIQAANNGLRVVGEASGGSVALAMVGDVDPDVVVLDQMMPGMDGLECAAQIRAQRPDQAIVLCSAHLDHDMRRRADELRVAPCVPKTSIHELPEAIRAAIAWAS